VISAAWAMMTVGEKSSHFKRTNQIGIEVRFGRELSAEQSNKRRHDLGLKSSAKCPGCCAVPGIRRGKERRAIAVPLVIWPR